MLFSARGPKDMIFALDNPQEIHNYEVDDYLLVVNGEIREVSGNSEFDKTLFLLFVEWMDSMIFACAFIPKTTMFLLCIEYVYTVLYVNSLYLVRYRLYKTYL